MPTFPEILLGHTPAEREVLLRALPDHRVEAVNRAFAEWAHRGQVAPGGDWGAWVRLARLGYASPRAGAEWV
jgi:phage terminase large subunit-like protein